MKIQTNPIQLNTKERQNTPSKEKSVAFRGNADMVFQTVWKFLDTNKAWGANFVDIGAMVIPRTLVDFTRGPAAGMETARRESSGTINHSLIGAYGLLAASALGYGLNKAFPGVNAHKMFINSDNIDVMAELWHKHSNNEGKGLDGFLNDVMEKVKGFNPELNSEHGWVNLKDSKEEVIKTLKAELDKNELSKETKQYLKAVITRDTGAESKFSIEKGLKDLDTKALSLDTLIEDIYKFTKAAKSDKILETFKTSKLTDNVFIKNLKALNTKTALLGLGMAVFAGMCVQPFNMYLTKKKTGKDGFVGVEGREPDNSLGFKVLKSATAIAFALGALSTIGKSGSDIFKKLQFKGFTPSLEQFKLVYGLTIMSRLFSARDKNELREASIKDTLGFLNWLVFGGFVTKLCASAFEKIKGEKLINYNQAANGKGWFNWITRATIKTRDEILHTELKKVNIDTFKDGKALPFKKLLKLAAEHAPSAKSKIKYINIAQLIGYLYSGLVLGSGIPKLNIAITNAVEGKKKPKKDFYANPSNIAFLSKENQKFKAFVNFNGSK